MVSKARVDLEDPRENGENKDPQDPLSIRPIHPWQKVPEVTQASKVLRGSQEAEANQESLEPRGLQAHPSEMKIQ